MPAPFFRYSTTHTWIKGPLRDLDLSSFPRSEAKRPINEQVITSENARITIAAVTGYRTELGFTSGQLKSAPASRAADHQCRGLRRNYGDGGPWGRVSEVRLPEHKLRRRRPGHTICTHTVKEHEQKMPSPGAVTTALQGMNLGDNESYIHAPHLTSLHTYSTSPEQLQQCFLRWTMAFQLGLKKSRIFCFGPLSATKRGKRGDEKKGSWTSQCRHFGAEKKHHLNRISVVQCQMATCDIFESLVVAK
ncbi:hypothetical protein B0H14DRAFT_2564303 [Mycena olivaceomarginata]|nr:hypothetical protein B0H14DRAFT_2564303 [Mycena olivaceomarginata]